MKLVAALLVWLALLFGLPQVLICGALLVSSGWAMPLVLIFMLLPFVPLVLMQEVRRWQRLPPAASCRASASPSKWLRPVRRPRCAWCSMRSIQG